MRTYKFDLKISPEGKITLPFTPSLNDQEVEVIIIPKSEKRITKNAGQNFISKWSGFLSEENTDDSKYQYLSEKYK